MRCRSVWLSLVLLVMLATPAAAQLQRVPGALAFTAAAQTCADSGDGDPGALTVTVSGISYIALTVSDADGCDLTLSTDGQDGQVLTIVNLSANSASLADTSGVQELAGDSTLTLPQWGAAAFIYRSDRWVSSTSGGVPGCADDELLISDGSVYECVAIPGCDEIAEKLIYDDATNSFSCEADQTASGAGSGDVVGPTGATDECVPRFNSTTGKLLQDSNVCIDDAGAITLPAGVRQTFNPDGTNAGINVGSHAGNPSSPSNGDVWYNSSAQELTARIDGANVALGAGGNRSIGITIDGGGSTITSGVKGFAVVPVSGTITAATLLSTDAMATACSVVIDVWVDSVGNYPPTDADSITASAPPTLGTEAASHDTTLTGWTTALTAGTVMGFAVDSVTGCTRVTLTLTVAP